MAGLIFYTLFVELKNGTNVQYTGYGDDTTHPFDDRKQAESFAAELRKERDVERVEVITTVNHLG